MKHAGPEALDRLEPLLTTLRTLTGLREKSRGTFYRGSRAFLHFHEDPAGLFADVRLDVEFERLRVTTAREQDRLLRRVRVVLSSPNNRVGALRVDNAAQCTNPLGPERSDGPSVE
jgi:hypothetical protein